MIVNIAVFQILFRTQVVFSVCCIFKCRVFHILSQSTCKACSRSRDPINTKVLVNDLRCYSCVHVRQSCILAQKDDRQTRGSEYASADKTQRMNS